MEQVTVSGIILRIDIFFRSLAHDQESLVISFFCQALPEMGLWMDEQSKRWVDMCWFEPLNQLSLMGYQNL